MVKYKTYSEWELLLTPKNRTTRGLNHGPFPPRGAIEPPPHRGMGRGGYMSANWASGILRRVKSLDGVSLSFGRTKAVVASLQPSLAFGSTSSPPPISTVLCHVTWRPASYSSGPSLPHPPSFPSHCLHPSGAGERSWCIPGRWGQRFCSIAKSALGRRSSSALPNVISGLSGVGQKAPLCHPPPPLLTHSHSVPCARDKLSDVMIRH